MPLAHAPARVSSSPFGNVTSESLAQLRPFPSTRAWGKQTGFVAPNSRVLVPLKVEVHSRRSPAVNEVVRDRMGEGGVARRVVAAAGFFPLSL